MTNAFDFSTNGHEIFDADRDPSLPPNAVHAEEAVFGSILKNPHSVRQIVDLVHDKDFYLPKHQAMWRAVAALEASGTPIDYHMLGDKLQSQGSYDMVGGLLYLSEINLATPTSALIVHYAHIVVRKAMQRRIISTAQHLTEAAWRDDKDPEALIDEMVRRLAKLAARAAEDTPVMADQAASELWAALESEYERWQKHDFTKGEYVAGWRTGLADLDGVLLGLKAGDLIYLAARTSVGKSILAQQIAMNVANHGGGVYFASLEMSYPKLMQRAITMRTGVARHELARGNVTDEERGRVKSALDEIGQLALAWDCKSRTVDQIRRKVTRWADDRGEAPALIVVDYVQLLRDQAGPRANRYENVSAASHALKEMAEALQCTVLAPAQVSRQVMNRRTKMPDLSDLRESGDLEQDCDLALGLDRANYHDRATDDLTATLAILKARDLSAGRGRGTLIPLAWLPKYEHYGDLARDNVVPFRRATLPDDEPPPNGHDEHGELPF